MSDTSTTPQARAADVTAPATSNTSATPGPSVTNTALKAAIVGRLDPVVRATPGVATLVPTTATALRRLRLSNPPTPTPTDDTSGLTAGTPGQATGSVDTHRPAGTDGSGSNATDISGDGITITLTGGAVTAVLDITVTTFASVLTTARAVHAAASSVLEATHPGRHSVSVNVLGLDSGGDGGRDASPADVDDTSIPLTNG